jgi:predicted nucleic acid-binding protein
MFAIVDTGPLVTFFDRSEQHHRWSTERIKELELPLLVCEPVLAEAMYLLARYWRAHDALFELLQNGALRVAFRIDQHVNALRDLLRKYRDTPSARSSAKRSPATPCASFHPAIGKNTAPCTTLLRYCQYIG